MYSPYSYAAQCYSLSDTEPKQSRPGSLALLQQYRPGTNDGWYIYRPQVVRRCRDGLL